jgi:hypothetical protein
MCFRLIDAKRAQHPVSLLCGVLGVSRAGFYAWKDRPACVRDRRDRELLTLIRQIHGDSDGSYGWPRMHAELRHRGVHVGRKRVARLMRRAGLSGLLTRRRGKTTIRVPGVRPAPDLVHRDFRPAAPNALWAADLTEIATWEGKLYLAAVIDCLLRALVGVMDEPNGGLALPDGHLERLDAATALSSAEPRPPRRARRACARPSPTRRPGASTRSRASTDLDSSRMRRSSSRAIRTRAVCSARCRRPATRSCQRPVVSARAGIPSSGHWS